MIHYENMTKDRIISLLKDTLEYAEKKDKEIERLNKCYCERTDCAGRIKNSRKFESVEEENERLNNIINELEKWLKEKNKFYEISTMGYSYGVTKEVIDKLQELKGSDKE